MRSSSEPVTERELVQLVRELHAHVNSKIRPKKVLQKLVSAGCDANAILLGLCQYDCMSPESIRMGRKNQRQKSHRIAKLACTLAEASDEIKFADGVLREHGFICNFAPDTDSLLIYSKFLRRIVKGILAKMSSKRVPSRDVFLVYVSQVVRKATGKPYFKELALLVNSLRRVYRPETDEVATEALEKRIRRYGPLEEDEMMAVSSALESCGRNHNIELNSP